MNYEYFFGFLLIIFYSYGDSNRKEYLRDDGHFRVGWFTIGVKLDEQIDIRGYFF